MLGKECVFFFFMQPDSSVRVDFFLSDEVRTVKFSCVDKVNSVSVFMNISPYLTEKDPLISALNMLWAQTFPLYFLRPA